MPKSVYDKKKSGRKRIGEKVIEENNWKDCINENRIGDN